MIQVLKAATEHLNGARSILLRYLDSGRAVSRLPMTVGLIVTAFIEG
jgi:hypothetical protein